MSCKFINQWELFSYRNTWNVWLFFFFLWLISESYRQVRQTTITERRQLMFDTSIVTGIRKSLTSEAFVLPKDVKGLFDTLIACGFRKGTGTTWTCSWWPLPSSSVPSWVCRGMWPPPSPLWPTSWVSRRSPSALPLGNGPLSLASGRWPFGTTLWTAKRFWTFMSQYVVLGS